MNVVSFYVIVKIKRMIQNCLPIIPRGFSTDRSAL